MAPQPHRTSFLDTLQHSNNISKLRNTLDMIHNNHRYDVLAAVAYTSVVAVGNILVEVGEGILVGDNLVEDNLDCSMTSLVRYCVFFINLVCFVTIYLPFFNNNLLSLIYV